MVSKEIYCTSCGAEIQTEFCPYCGYSKKESETNLEDSFSLDGKSAKIPQRGFKEIPSNEILNKIEKSEPIEYEQVIIVGDIDIRNLELPKTSLERSGHQIRMNLPKEMKVVGSQINLINSIFLGNVNFDNSFFDNKLNFQGCIFKKDVSFRGAAFLAEVYFNRTTFYGQELDGIDFTGTAFNSNVYFENAKFLEEVNFSGAILHYIRFRKTLFSKDTYFLFTTFHGFTDFEETTFLGKTNHFSDASFKDLVLFTRAKFIGIVTFDYVEFKKETWFTGAEFGGEFLSFEGSLFDDLYSQEHACRKAKIVMGKAGERGAEGYHYYREMEAIRKQKGFLFSKDDDNERNKSQSLRSENWDIVKRIIFYDVLEFIFVQKIFGYGVHPWRLMSWWLTIILLFAGLYYIDGGISGAEGLFDYLKVSFATAIAPGYIAVIINPASSAGYNITDEWYQIVAMIETIVGTFLWAGFIATFAKRYMR